MLIEYARTSTVPKIWFETSDFSGKDPTVRRRRSKPLIPSTLAGGGSVDEMISVALWTTVGVFGVLE